MRPVRPGTETRGYTAVAIVLHWAIAAAIVGNFLLGLWMHEAIDAAATRAHAVAVFQLHKSIGLSVLALTLLRLLWRLTHRAPALPVTMPGWEKVAAHLTHGLMYVLMLAIPLSGWLYVSTQWRNDAALQVPTIWFGLFQVPHLFDLQDAAVTLRSAYADTFLDSHEFLAWSMVVLLVLHVGAALKHRFVDHDEVPGHMIPLLASAEQRRSASTAHKLVLRAGLLATAIALGFGLWAALRPPQPASAQASSAASAAADKVAIATTEGGWELVPAQSFIRFSGDNAGTPFSGTFNRWQADLAIDLDQPVQSRVHATIWTASATDGIKMHEEALPTTEWFDVAEYPTASYAVIRVIPNEDGTYLLEGELTIKDHSHPVGPLQLRIENGTATISGKVAIEREAFDLGMESDPNGEWVSNEITVDVQAVAIRP